MPKPRKKHYSQFVEKCIEDIESHDIESFKNRIDGVWVSHLKSNDIMHHVCKIGCFDSFLLLIEKKVFPDITDIEWASVGTNEHQKDIFDYAVKNFPSLPFHERDFTSLSYACKRQRKATLINAISIYIEKAKSPEWAEKLAMPYLTFITGSASFNNHQILAFLIKQYEISTTLKVAIDNQIRRTKYSTLPNFFSGYVAPIVIRKRYLESLKVICNNYSISSLGDTRGLVRKSYSNERIREFFVSLPVSERHGMLKGMVSSGKRDLAIELFRSIPENEIPSEPEQLSRLLSPMIEAYDTDPLSFFERDDVPASWLPALHAILAD